VGKNSPFSRSLGVAFGVDSEGQVSQGAGASCRGDGNGVGIDFIMARDWRLGRVAASGVRALCGKLMVLLVVMLDGDDNDGVSTSCR
jgi:hypothetical protein